MEFDSKQKVLIAIYMEYQKDIPNMDSVSAASVGLEPQVFAVAVDKLDNEGLIKGVNITSGCRDNPIIFMNNAKMTSYGLNYVETKLGIQPEKTGLEKIKEISQNAVSWGWNEAKDFAAKVLSEIIQAQAGPR